MLAVQYLTCSKLRSEDRGAGCSVSLNGRNLDQRTEVLAVQYLTWSKLRSEDRFSCHVAGCSVSYMVET